jgi:hypothetical protein
MEEIIGNLVTTMVSIIHKQILSDLCIRKSPHIWINTIRMYKFKSNSIRKSLTLLYNCYRSVPYGTQCGAWQWYYMTGENVGQLMMNGTHSGMLGNIHQVAYNAVAPMVPFFVPESSMKRINQLVSYSRDLLEIPLQIYYWRSYWRSMSPL